VNCDSFSAARGAVRHHRGAMMRLGIALLLALTATARAQEDAPEKQQARVLLGQGNALFERGDLKGALADFRAAYALYPSPKLLVNAAAAERELGDLPAAANDLRRFLDEAAEEDPFLIDRARQDLKALERRVARVSFPGWPQKSSFEIDGRTVRDPSYVRAGGHRLKGRAPNGVEEERDANVGVGESAELPAPSRAGAAPAATSRDTQPPPEAG